jgi:hypothetical protein
MGLQGLIVPEKIPDSAIPGGLPECDNFGSIGEASCP